MMSEENNVEIDRAHYVQLARVALLARRIHAAEQGGMQITPEAWSALFMAVNAAMLDLPAEIEQEADITGQLRIAVRRPVIDHELPDDAK